jgi:hypothetical protein
MIMQAMCEEVKRITVSKIVTVTEVTIPGAPSQTDRSKTWNVASDNRALSQCSDANSTSVP